MTLSLTSKSAKRPPTKPLGRETELAWLVLVLVGSSFYGWLVFGLQMQSDLRPFGWWLFDEAFLAFSAGELNLPARALTLEGHFKEDGTAYLYHGIGPLLTRLFLAPFVDVATTPLAPFSIWFWASIGTACYHRAFVLVAHAAWPASGPNAGFWFVMLAVAIWLGGPGLLLGSNLSLYQEPIVLAYAMSAGVLLLWVRAAIAGRPALWSLAFMALLAAICVHARPHVAMGLYIIVVGATLWSLRRALRAAIAPACFAMVLLAVGGVSYLGYNTLRFGDATTTHSSFDSGVVQYGFTYWGVEPSNSARASAFLEHGRFNLKRVLPNAALYLLQPPQTLAPELQDAAVEIHREISQGAVGMIRVEGPGVGVLSLWTVWALLAAAGISAGWHALRPWFVPIAGTAAIALSIFAYATVTLRYHVDLWPALAVLALVGLQRVTPFLGHGPLLQSRKTALLIAGSIGILISSETATVYSRTFAAKTDGIWSLETCLEFVERRSFTAGQIEEICRDPRVKYARLSP